MGDRPNTRSFKKKVEADKQSSIDEQAQHNGCEESGESQGNSFELLPQELQALIIEYLPQRDKLQKRLVCKHMQKVIDEYATFKIEYNSIKEELQDQIMKLRIRSFEISGKHMLTQSFSHPLIVREVIFGANVLEETTKRVLSECKNVEVLQCFSTCFSDTTFLGSIDHTEYLHKLKKLKSIILGIFFFSSRSPSFLGKTFKTLIGNSSLVFPSLSQVRIDYEMTKAEWIDLCRFAERHKDSLKSISVSQCICDIARADDEFASASCLPDLNSLARCNLTSIKAVKRHRNCSCRGEIFWSHIIQPQKNVELLWTNLVPSVQHIINFVKKYQTTLRSLKLYHVEIGVHLTNISGGVFSDCVNLSELFIQFNPCAIFVVDIAGKTANSGKESSRDARDARDGPPVERRFCEFTGFHLLPTTLTSITLAGCIVATCNLLEASATLVNLRELRLSDPCSGLLILGSEYGVNKEVILSYMAKTTFNKLSIHTKFIQRKRSEPANVFGIPGLDLIFQILAENDLVELRGNIMDEMMQSAPATIYRHHEFSDSELRAVELDIYFNRYTGTRQELTNLCTGSGSTTSALLQ